jgi:hypothetical protein
VGARLVGVLPTKRVFSLRKPVALCFKETKEMPMAEQTILVDTGHANTCLATERRAWVRIRSEQSIHCQLEEATTSWLARLQDVSAGGLAFIAPRRIEPGTALTVELATKADGSCSLLARVIHATQVMDDRWVIGCAFTELLSAQQLLDFIEA